MDRIRLWLVCESGVGHAAPISHYYEFRNRSQVGDWFICRRVLTCCTFGKIVECGDLSLL